MIDTIQGFINSLRHDSDRDGLGYLDEVADEIERLRELLIETRAQIGMNTCGGDLHSPTYWAFLEHLSKELGLDSRRLCEPGYPKWSPSSEESERGIDHFVAEGLRQFREKL
jgi:hypothetical protein